MRDAEAVVAWIRENPKRTARKAAVQFGIPLATVKTWLQRAVEGRPVASHPREEVEPGVSRAKRRAPEPEDEPDETPDDEPEWDPTTCDREEWLVRSVQRCLRAAAKATSHGHGGVARQWEITAGGYRDELDKLREAKTRAAEARGRQSLISARDVADRCLRGLPAWVRISPALAREIHDELGKALDLYGVKT